jgi:PilZ domain
MMDQDSRLDPAVERRASKRFTIQEDAAYRILDSRVSAPESGVGKTIDISSSGVLFGTEQRLRSGKRIEVSINWPAPLDGNCPLKFVIVGRVVRVEDMQAAVCIEQYEFRTRRTKELPAFPDRPFRSPVPYH